MAGLPLASCASSLARARRLRAEHRQTRLRASRPRRPRPWRPVLGATRRGAAGELAEPAAGSPRLLARPVAIAPAPDHGGAALRNAAARRILGGPGPLPEIESLWQPDCGLG